jgi:hypothetical protein
MTDQVTIFPVEYYIVFLGGEDNSNSFLDIPSVTTVHDEEGLA